MLPNAPLQWRVWRTVDNFRPFHQASLVEHPVGDVLQEKLRIEEEEKRGRSQFLEWYRAYKFGSLIEDSYGLAPIAEVAASAIGAARLIVFPSFSPERFITLSFHQDGVTLEAVCGRTSLWDSRGNPECFDAGDAFRKRVELAYHRLPPAFRSWESFSSISAAAESSVRTNTIDGVSYRHRTADSNKVADATWGNPYPEEHAAQTRIIGDYQRLITQAGVGRYLCQDRWEASVFSTWWQRIRGGTQP